LPVAYLPITWPPVCKSYGSQLVLTSCVFARNRFGGMRVEDGGGAMLTDCTFEDNSFPGGFDGGGLLANAVVLTLTRCVFARNTGDLGGALFGVNFARLQIEDCSFTENHASSGVPFVWSGYPKPPSTTPGQRELGELGRRRSLVLRPILNDGHRLDVRRQLGRHEGWRRDCRLLRMADSQELHLLRQPARLMAAACIRPLVA